MKRHSPETIYDVMARWRSGESIKCISNALGWTPKAVKGVVRRNRLPDEFANKIFESPEDILKVGRLYRDGLLSIEATAQIAGISRRAVGKIVKKHFPHDSRGRTAAALVKAEFRAITLKEMGQHVVKHGCSSCGLPIVSRSPARRQNCPECMHFAGLPRTAKAAFDKATADAPYMNKERVLAEENAARLRKYYAERGENVVVKVERVDLGAASSNRYAQHTYSAVIV